MASQAYIHFTEFKKLIRGLADKDVYILRKILSNEINFHMMIPGNRDEDFLLAEETIESLQYFSNSPTNSGENGINEKFCESRTWGQLVVYAYVFV